MASLRLTVTSWILLAATASAAPQGLDPNTIIFPDEINNIRNRLALEQCRQDPNCATPHHPDPNLGCSSGSGGAETMLRNVINLRRGVGTCNSMTREVRWPATGECVKLLTQGPCPPGQWVKLTLSTFEPVCEPQPCSDREALVEGSCHSLADVSKCPPRQQMFINEAGEGECDCQPGMVFFEQTNSCYTPYTQGPCQPGYIIRVMDAGVGGRARCERNACPSANMVPMDSRCHIHTTRSAGISCFDINTPGPCADGELAIDNVINEPVCLQTETHSIFNLPNTKSCPRGSIRDTLGRCRRDVSLTFRPLPPVRTSRPGPQPDNDGLCPTGYELLGGTCIRLG
ncbi:uncharacterized protein LOC134786993 [Penaeus indicus]|uniref:uncharacterized protein LOC134786993 n=1 Tax=Penaeus indicus TaxID=29960 RepID=UPI00300C7642